MQEDENYQDPFNWYYFFAAVAVLVALPLMHPIIGWFVYYL
ncbi:hypothetical protein RS130_13710 [Paraglaciecola aquimarina]|uniref:Uncharacterized protein n=1 Tax=Paraglaciecola aquimarina TaxID=1235557 RepID=A0ABU3SXW5_9ALTE|nr:hypothetical protein [Paraglaciecola aquimarina]MDU0354834.1 hypothetical protein [Paraglaciecola aquimarina]